MPTRFLWVLGAVIVISYFLSLKERKRRQSVWAGVVTDIKHQRPCVRDEDRRDDDWVTVHYHTDSGQDGKLQLRLASVRQFFTDIRVGDRLIKHQGDYLPCRASREPAESLSAEPLDAA